LERGVRSFSRFPGRRWFSGMLKKPLLAAD
jgi:hypothetical protein